MRTLIFDENIQNQNLFVSHLSRFGQVDIEKDAKQGLQKIRTDINCYSLVIINANFASMEAKELIAMIRDWEHVYSSGNHNIIVVTDKYSTTEMLNFYKLGCNLLLHTPLDKSQFESAIFNSWKNNKMAYLNQFPVDVSKGREESLTAL
ncbi:MAG: hypothetical protein QNL04_01520 [SAR324 cluster bacterium]|nr:hypothetical protein [SAR324 cluster bacterium]